MGEDRLDRGHTWSCLFGGTNDKISCSTRMGVGDDHESIGWTVIKEVETNSDLHHKYRIKTQGVGLALHSRTPGS